MNDCQDPRCTRVNGKCVGMHCSYCGEPCSSQGHPECYDAAGDAAMARALENQSQALSALPTDELKKQAETFTTAADNARTSHIASCGCCGCCDCACDCPDGCACACGCIDEDAP